MNPDILQQILERLVRVETRLTRYLQQRGFDTGADKPRYSAADGTIKLPSPHCRLEEVLNCIPAAEYGKEIPTYVGDDFLGFVIKEGEQG